MIDRTPFRPNRAVTAIVGVGALSTAFLAAPTLSLPSAPAALPAASTAPVTPTTKHVALDDARVTSVEQAGPQTKVPTKSFVNAPRRTVDRAGLTSDAVVEVPATGDLVGVTWPRSIAAAASSTVLVRVKTAQGWQEWHKVGVDAASGGTSERIGTEPIWAPGARRVQIRVSAADRALLASAQLAAVTSPGRAADGRLRPTAVPGAASAAYQPSVITRAQWGANESLRRCNAEYSTTTKAVTVHHTADTNSYSPSDSARMLRSIYAYDTRSLGWCDIAYNVIVDKYGQVFEGRAGGLNRPVKASHAYAFNNDTFGVSILGNYEEVPVPWAGFNALASAIAMRLDAFYLDPYAKVSLTSTASGGTTRYRAGTTVALNRINPHRDTSYTLCPGKYLYPRMQELRRLAASKLTYQNSASYKRWVAVGGARTLGPVSVGESTVSPGLRKTTFTGGQRIYTGPTGTFRLGTKLDVGWWNNGGSDVGQLVTNEAKTALGTYVKLSNGAYVTATPTGSAYMVRSSILPNWLRTGGATASPLGMATMQQQWSSTHTWQRFANGTIHVRAWDGSSYQTLSGIDKAYWAQGGPKGRFGSPLGNRRAVGGGWTQSFAGGTITTSASGAATLTRR